MVNQASPGGSSVRCVSAAALVVVGVLIGIGLHISLEHRLLVSLRSHQRSTRPEGQDRTDTESPLTEGLPVVDYSKRPSDELEETESNRDNEKDNDGQDENEANNETEEEEEAEHETEAKQDETDDLEEGTDDHKEKNETDDRDQATAPEQFAEDANKLHLWLDPFDLDPRRRTEPYSGTRAADGVIGPCRARVRMPDRKLIKTTGIICSDGIRQLMDKKLHACLLKQAEFKDSLDTMLWEAVGPGFEMSARLLVAQGSNPLYSASRTIIRSIAQRRSRRFEASDGGNLNFLFDPTRFSLAHDKNVIQLAIMGGFSRLAHFLAESSGRLEVDDRNRTLSDYVRGRGSPIRPDAAHSDMGITVSPPEPMETPPKTEPSSCDGEVLSQQLGWHNRSTRAPYGKCDFDVVDTLTPETYRRDYLETGRPVVLRNFVDDAARCLGTRDRFTKWVGNNPVSVGQTAYPGITGSLPCERRETIGELERAKECPEFPGVSVYHAEHVAPRSEPLRLEETQYFEELSKILDIGPMNLSSKQLFYGGDRSGAALHCHSAAFNALYVGQKDWFLIPPHRAALSGMAAEKLWSDGRYRKQHVLRCTQNAGDVILVPDGWGHSTMSHGFAMGLGILYKDKSDKPQGGKMGRRRDRSGKQPARKRHDEHSSPPRTPLPPHQPLP